MQFGFIGINYKKAQLEIRDKTSFTDGMKIEFFQKAETIGIDQCMVLSTCNRSEVYFFFEKNEQLEQIEQIYREMFPEVELEDYLTRFVGEEALAYLFRIAAGLESLVLGEDQILGQVREALDFSRAMGHSKKELNKVVREAVTCAKKIKTELKISEKPLSVSYIGIQKLNETCGIKGKRALVIGSGKTAVLALKYLYEYEAGEVYACSRNLEHAEELKEEFDSIRIVRYEKRYELMKQCDIVISATASPHVVVKREQFTPERPVTFLDLAAPRDIDTAFEKEELVQLINLDTLLEIAKENQRERERLVEQSKTMIAEALEETKEWLLQSRMDATIESLQQRCSEIVEDSYEYLNRKMELSHREQKLLRKVLHASLQRLLHEPIQELKQLDTKEEQEQYRRLVQQLFQIESE
ncbi:MAG: glutamyl-tRNA reductase [Roseburia sp.]